MTISEVKSILNLVSFPGYTWHVRGDFTDDADPTCLYAKFRAPCAEVGALGDQTTRKWQLSQFMTRSEVVQTALKCVLTAIEHEAREQFKYRGWPIFGPHFDVERLADLCAAGATEVRL